LIAATASCFIIEVLAKLFGNLKLINRLRVNGSLMKLLEISRSCMSEPNHNVPPFLQELFILIWIDNCKKAREGFQGENGEKKYPIRV
jgi:hypothetical protein